MTRKISIIITTISDPNEALIKFAQGCKTYGYDLILIGDVSSPPDFNMNGCDYYSVERQKQSGLKLAALCPERHYARKNIGYLLAMQRGSTIIIDTDDDNLPYDSFWTPRQRVTQASVVEIRGWINVYRYFSDTFIWPRGLPLNFVSTGVPTHDSLPVQSVDSPIQQGLANENPDVDAIYRLLFSLPENFSNHRRIALSKGVWSPFNSQNTTWWRDAFPLLYLPAYCSFRMTDIWRGFVAQRIAWENNWKILFHRPTVRQERNEHDLMRDFSDEIPGYLNNEKICDNLAKLRLRGGTENLTLNLLLCYEKLIDMGLIPQEEMPLLDAWTDDLKTVTDSCIQS